MCASPEGVTLTLSHSTLIWTPADSGVVGSQVSPKLTTAGVGVLSTVQRAFASRAAVMSLLTDWGAISLTGIELSLLPTPCVPPVSLTVWVCSEEPGYRCDPTASRKSTSNTHLVPLGCVMWTAR